MSVAVRSSPAEVDAYEAATLRQRIADNEAVWGPGCRPELRQRLRDVEARIRRRDEQAEARVLQGREVRFVTFTIGGKLHVEDYANGPALCGAYDQRDWSSGGQRSFSRSDAYRAVGDPRVCGRCKASLRAWAKND